MTNFHMSIIWFLIDIRTRQIVILVCEDVFLMARFILLFYSIGFVFNGKKQIMKTGYLLRNATSGLNNSYIKKGRHKLNCDGLYIKDYSEIYYLKSQSLVSILSAPPSFSTPVL